MATKLYLHNSSNGTTGLPTTKQSSVTISGGASQSVNKNMTTTIGGTQTSIAVTGATSNYTYICRWVSDVIGQTSIAANTWTITFGFKDGAGATQTFHAALYVWRPSTTTKIATIFDGDYSLATFATTTEKGYKRTFSGSAVASGIQSSDVLCMEFIYAAASPVTQTVYYEGNTDVTTDATTMASVASYLSTPETITLGAPSTITMTPNAATITNKFIHIV